MSTRIDVAERCGRFLSSRRLARQLRQEVEALIRGGQAVTVSFHGVESISNSFADGLLGVLMEAHGREWFARNVAVEGLQEDDLRDLRAILALRAEQAAPRNGDDLVSAVG